MVFYSIIFLLASYSLGLTQDDKVIVEIVTDDKVEKIEFEWPFKGPPVVGSDSALVLKVEKILNDNDIDCPPERDKVTDNVWRCGNGKLIRTKDSRMARLLKETWDN